MPTTYTNGLKLPDLGSIDWFNAYKNNIDILDPIVGTVNGVATTYAPISHNHDASEITSGTIDIARLPPAALERLTTVADQTARYALTTSTIQLGDTVKQLDTGIMYLVVDTTKLNSADGYVEYSAGTASKAIADEDGTSIKTGYVNVAGNQTVTGDKTWSGSNTFNNILPNATSTYSLGSSSYQWSSVYAQTYYYNGTAWGLDKANAWTDTNTFSAVSYGEKIKLKNTGLDLSSGNPALSSTYQHMIWWDDKNNTHYAKVQAWANDTNGTIILASYYRADANTVRNSSLRNQCGATSKSFFPDSNSDTDLGTSTNKWKTLNGINPGALSLPNPAAMVEIDTTGWSVAGALNNTYTPMVNGWLAIDIKDTATNSVFIYPKGLSSSKSHSVSVYGNGSQGTGRLSLMMPAIANVQYAFVIKAGSLSDVDYVRFFPCLGNV